MRRRTLGAAVAMLFLALAVVACSGNDKKKDGKLTDKGPTLPPYFSLIPADSPYVFAEQQPFPYEMLQWQALSNYGEVIGTARKSLKESLAADPQADQNAKFLLAVLEEFEGKMSKQGFAELGLDPTANFAFYGLGIFPVLRLGLKDPKAFNAMIARVEKRAGTTLPKAKVGKFDYQILHRETGGPDGLELHVVLGVTATEVVLSAVPNKTKDKYLKLAFGLEKPKNPLIKQNHIETLQKRYKLKPFLSGYVDNVALVNAALSPGQDMLGQSLKELGYSKPALPPNCEGEYRKMVAKTPRMIFGYQDLTRTSADYFFGLETEKSLGEKMARVVAPVPGNNSQLTRESLAFMGLGVDLNALSDLLRSETERLRNDPYKCEHLADFNQAAEEGYLMLKQLPQWTTGISGLAISLRDVNVDIDQRQIKGVEASAVIRAKDPLALWTTLQTLEPKLKQVTLKSDGQPVSIPLPPEIARDMPTLPQPQIAMNQSSIGISIGLQGKDDMLSLLKETPDKTSTSLGMMAYNLEKILTRLETSLPQSAETDDILKTLRDFWGNTTLVITRFELEERGAFLTFSSNFKPLEAKK